MASCDIVHMSSNFNLVNNCEHGVNVPTVAPDSGNALHVNNNVDYSDSGVKYVTKHFYRSDLDRKEIRGLIAKGNRTKVLGLSNSDIVVKSRTFVDRQSPLTKLIKKVSNPTMM